MRKAKSDWWKEIFDDRYLDSYPTQNMVENAKDEVEKILRRLSLKKESKILDLGCGYGRHSLEFAKRGYDVIGLDYSTKFIKMAKESATSSNLTNIQFIQGDMRNIPFENHFDAIVNLFTSFGYFDKETDHQKVLNEISKSLKKGGYFLIDIQNARRFVTKTRSGRIVLNKEFTGEYENLLPDGTVVHVKNEFDLNIMQYNNHVSWVKDGQQKEYYFSVRCFFKDELRGMLEVAGLKFIKAFGSYDGEQYTTKQKRLIILSQKV